MTLKKLKSLKPNVDIMLQFNFFCKCRPETLLQLNHFHILNNFCMEISGFSYVTLNLWYGFQVQFQMASSSVKTKNDMSRCHL